MSTDEKILSPAAAPDRAMASRPQSWRLYVALMKPKVISLLLITTVAAMLVAAQGLPAWPVLWWTLLGGTLSAGGANALNHFFDRDIDAVMYRTNRRPIPAGWLAPERAIAFGLFLILLAVLLLGTQVNWLAAGLSLLGALYYIIIYTLWLKRATWHNITIGGVAGAIPPLVGWAAVTGELSLTAWVLFAIVFFWTPPHTWALTLMVSRDYQRVGVPMLPIVKGEVEAQRLVLQYSWLFVLITVLPVAFGVFGWLYLLVAALTGAQNMRLAYRLRRLGSKAAARSLYKYSLLHLALLFTAMVLDAII